MACGKGAANQPIEDFITHSPAPVDLAAKMSAIYTELSFKVNLNPFYFNLCDLKTNLTIFLFSHSISFFYYLTKFVTPCLKLN